MSSIFSFTHGDDAVMHGEFMGFALDDESLMSLRGWVERQGYPQASVQQGGPDIFAQMLESSAPPKMAIVDIDGQTDAAAITARIVSLCGGECRLVVIGSTNDVTLYRRILGAGAIDYLVKPLSPAILNQALATALRAPIGGAKPEVKESSLVVFIGTRGGAGASTIALNAGWLMAHEYDRNVALFDLDLQFGTSSLALDLEPGRGLRDIVSSPNRVDGLMIASSIVPESERFSILGAEESVDEVVPIDSSAITALLKEMKSNFDVIIIDLPRHMMASHKRLLAAAHEVVLVSDLTLAGIRDTLRIKSALTNLGCAARMSVVASRVDASGQGHISSAVFEKGTQGLINIIVPDDTASLAQASNKGKALGDTAPRAPITNALRELALRLMNADAQTLKKKHSVWNDILDAIWGKVAAKTKGNGRGKPSGSKPS